MLIPKLREPRRHSSVSTSKNWKFKMADHRPLWFRFLALTRLLYFDYYDFGVFYPCILGPGIQ